MHAQTGRLAFVPAPSPVSAPAPAARVARSSSRADSDPNMARAGERGSDNRKEADVQWVALPAHARVAEARPESEAPCSFSLLLRSDKVPSCLP